MLIRLVGLVTIEHEGEAPRHLSSAQAQVTFTRLVLERSAGTSRDQLADTLWPQGLPDTWASALRSVVSRVRTFVTSDDQKPGGTPLIAQSGRYLLHLPGDAVTDLEAAEAAVSEARQACRDRAHAVAQQLATGAVANLRGSFLPAHEGEWVNTTRERIDELRLTALELASVSAAALGNGHHALRYADEAVRRAPFRESAHRCQMAAHAAAGNRADALRVYHQLRELLSDELGIEPAPRTQCLYLDLLREPGPQGLPAPDPAAEEAAAAVDPLMMAAFQVLRPPAA
ncbi:BTAD domain-containing putative transcriptional regulator [Streptomyces sp. NBC_00859]|uniref:AfsR/SARP family transcriptional regulator n=1 Tax=Streptomyces sp. NBC_00859 TaxID=2903682 RepID=UPI0038692D3F|nr:bacterial transcriptional activator domain-containing protein [Streptomyces sp. NBC_00859]